MKTLTILPAVAALAFISPIRAAPLDGNHAAVESRTADLRPLGIAFGNIYSEYLQNAYPGLHALDFGADATLSALETVLDRLYDPHLDFVQLAYRDPTLATRRAMKALDSVRQPILNLDGFAASPYTPIDSLRGITFKLEWLMREEGALFSDREAEKIWSDIFAARSRLDLKIRMDMEAAMAQFRPDFRGANGIAPSRATVPLVYALSRSFSGKVPYLKDRLYASAAAARLKRDAANMIVWRFDHVVEDHWDPFHHGLRYRPDFIKALDHVARTAKEQGVRVVQAIVTPGELWWLTPLLEGNQDVLEHIAFVMGNEHLSRMNRRERKQFPELTRAQTKSFSARYLAPFGIRAAIDDKGVMPRLVQRGVRFLGVPRAFSGPGEGDILYLAADEAIDAIVETAPLEALKRPKAL